MTININATQFLETIYGQNTTMRLEPDKYLVTFALARFAFRNATRSKACTRSLGLQWMSTVKMRSNQ